MPLINSRTEYGSVTKFFHWLLFLLIAGMLAVGFIMVEMNDSPGKFRLYFFHKAIGLLILGLMALRLLWTVSNPKPQLPTHVPSLLRWGAIGGHWLLYLLLFAMPLSGWILSCAAGHPPSFFGLFQASLPIEKNKALASFMGEVHETIAWIIIVVVSFHIIAALIHHYYFKDNVLRRILPFGKK